MRISDWSSDVCSSDLAEIRMVEVVAVEVVDRRTQRAGAHEGIDVPVLAVEHGHGAHGLVGIVAAHHAFAGTRIVGLSDLRPQQQADIVQREGAKHDELRRLLDLAAAAVDISDADGALRSEEHTSELQSLMRISYAVFCLKKKKK